MTVHWYQTGKCTLNPKQIWPRKPLLNLEEVYHTDTTSVTPATIKVQTWIFIGSAELAGSEDTAGLAATVLFAATGPDPTDELADCGAGSRTG